MKNLALLLLLLVGCTPVRYVNFEKRHNYYQKHRHNTYTIPVFIPGKGIILQTKVIPYKKRPRKH